MDRPVLEIPGYYYDREKRKYFKIQKSSAAPASAAYSAQDVKRRKTHDAMAEAAAQRMARQKGRIRKSGVLQEPLAGGFLAREQGESASLDDASIYARGLVPQGFLTSLMQFYWCSDPLFDIDHRPDLGASMVDVRIVFDDRLFTIRVNADKNTRSTEHGSVEICHDFTLPTINNASWRMERFGHPGTSTSLTTHQESRRLAMTWLAGSPQSGIAIVPMAGIPRDGDADRPIIIMGPGVTRGMDVDIYTSAAAPPNSPLLFAFGTSHGFFTVSKRDTDTSWISPAPTPSPNNPKDIFALEFLSDNPSILLSGTRKGTLNITDLRIPKFGADSDVINHPSSITHIKQLDMHRILVAGLDSTMCQYDLRFRKMDTPTPTPAPVWRSRKTYTSYRNPKPTRSILIYPDYHNNASIQLGLDIDLEAGILAAAQEWNEQHSKVQLFSLHGGHKLKSPISKGETLDTGDDGGGNIKCVKWARDIAGRGKSLWVGVKPDIQRFGWADWEERD